MSISSIILYGSRARGDHRRDSDVDLLGVVDTPTISRTPAVRGANLHLYPFDYLINKAKSGDLFLLHLTSEGKPLFDSFGIFKSLQESFKYKKSYSKEISEGTAVVLFLCSNPAALKKETGRKRLVWGFRTILIGAAADRGLAIFSSRKLEEFSNIENLKTSIDNKFRTDFTTISEVARAVTTSFGDRDLVKSWPNGKLSQMGAIMRSGRIGRSTAKLVFPSIEVEDFEGTEAATYPNIDL